MPTGRSNSKVPELGKSTLSSKTAPLFHLQTPIYRGLLPTMSLSDHCRYWNTNTKYYCQNITPRVLVNCKGKGFQWIVCHHLIQEIKFRITNRIALWYALWCCMWSTLHDLQSVLAKNTKPTLLKPLHLTSSL